LIASGECDVQSRLIGAVAAGQCGRQDVRRDFLAAGCVNIYRVICCVTGAIGASVPAPDTMILAVVTVMRHCKVQGDIAHAIFGVVGETIRLATIGRRRSVSVGVIAETVDALDLIVCGIHTDRHARSGAGGDGFRGQITEAIKAVLLAPAAAGGREEAIQRVVGVRHGLTADRIVHRGDLAVVGSGGIGVSEFSLAAATQGSSEGQLWVYHDPNYKPAGNWTKSDPKSSRDEFFTAASDSVRWWLP